MARIGLLHHPRDEWCVADDASLLNHLVQLHADRHTIVPVTDPGRAAEVDLLINHVDLTVVPEPFAAVLRAHPRTVNGHVLDISKRCTSDLVLGPDEDWEGPVIVKTNRNASGHQEERLLLGPARRAWARSWRRIRHRRGRTGRLRHVRTLPWGLYPVYERRDDVPPVVWRNAALVVERFLPERVDGDYAIRSYVFMGERGLAVRQIAPTPVIKARSVLRREPVEIPAQLEARRREMGFDHGKFDYVLVDGHPRILDANRTPWMVVRTSWHRDVIDYLAPGLGPFLQGFD